MTQSVPEIFGSKVFNQTEMKKRLPKDTFKELMKTIEEGKPLNIKIANAVSHAMKEWAIEQGATHYTHWFQPMTGVTAEKHDSFIHPTEDGNVVMTFSGKELIKGEPDASSFPNGGLRATFEARGYTAWDPTSYAFIKNKVLCIPTAFCSYTGHALDKKTPLLRSMEAINKQALRILKLFGHDEVISVKTTVGPEQEYFLVDQKYYEQRKDLIYTGRTLFGANSPKGQEMEDHYFGTIKTRVQNFMDELNVELWKLGINAKTEHNEVAPAQHELAPVFSTTNIATDHNQLTMELMQRIAKRHGLVCLLHEKPFDGVNGSGKHNNWSLSTNTGLNLLEPGETPYENAQFLLFLCAVIKAVDEHQDLLRLSVATAGNDHRLGANEAPPAIISIFLGDELTEVLEAIENGTGYNGKEKEYMRIGADVLPKFKKDSTDRNRTSPFAFTGNKFEFRMVGSQDSIAEPNVVLNTIVAEAFSDACDILEKADQFQLAVHDLIKKNFTEHERIIFNGDGYSDEWVKEAARRGLPNITCEVDAIPELVTEQTIRMYEKFHVFTRTELESRAEIKYENYAKTINIEAKAMINITSKRLIPAVVRYTTVLADSINAVRAAGVDEVSVQTELLQKTSTLLRESMNALRALSEVDGQANTMARGRDQAKFCHDKVTPAMEALRRPIDELEQIVDKSLWPMPSYGDLLFEV